MLLNPSNSNGFRLPEKTMEELNATARKAKKKPKGILEFSIFNNYIYNRQIGKRSKPRQAKKVGKEAKWQEQKARKERSTAL